MYFIVYNKYLYTDIQFCCSLLPTIKTYNVSLLPLDPPILNYAYEPRLDSTVAGYMKYLSKFGLKQYSKFGLVAKQCIRIWPEYKIRETGN